MKLARSLVEYLIYGFSDSISSSDAEAFGEGPRRFTQDSPILPDVWIEFGNDPNGTCDLLLTPRFGTTAGAVAGYVRSSVESTRRKGRSPSVAYNQTYVAADLTFPELIRIVLPMTRWWAEQVRDAIKDPKIGLMPSGAGDTFEWLRDSAVNKVLVEALIAYEKRDNESRISTDLLWMIRIVGSIAWAAKQKKSDTLSKPPTPRQMIKGVVDLIGDLPLDPENPDVWQVNINREARVAITRSTLAIKADAARLLFKAKCNHLAWAIVDSGIDARHLAFWNWDGNDLNPDVRRHRELKKRIDQARDEPPDDSNNDLWPRATRVRATYDFTRARELFDPSHLRSQQDWPDFVQRTIDLAPDAKKKRDLRRMAKELGERLQKDRGIDWALAEPFLRIPHTTDGYEPPSSEHGTHVAGILAANWPQREMEGVCPDIELYDMRVIKRGKRNDEFAVLAALQFLSHLNDQKDLFRVHGVNVSLAIRHDVANFACGRTPVCDECERAVASGVVVVAAAGNEGYLQYVISGGKTTEGYRTVSITDPGNAAKVITVGSTHRHEPHTYGVSYFSSRGPTGDGRIKPDLVAPGEKVNAPIPNLEERVKDGTSMAAPHVSGAAALLMARHQELIGQPDRIKQVLCDTATDLGRERYFQGAGMLDVLRALQSI